MAEETQVVRPLDSSEVKDAIAQTIAEKVRESLNSTCWLYGMAWPKFKADWTINVTLENFGQEQETSVEGTLYTHEFKDEIPVLTGASIPHPTTQVIEGTIPFTPPNVVRKKYGMPIPTLVSRDDGSIEQKAVVFRQTRGKRNAGPDPRAD